MIHVSGLDCGPLHNLSLAIPIGRISLLRGPSAIGKTRILRDILQAESTYRRKIASDPHFLQEPANLSEKPPVRQIANLPKVVFIGPAPAPASNRSIAEYLSLPEILAVHLRGLLPLACPVCSSTRRGMVEDFSADALASRLIAEENKKSLCICACFTSLRFDENQTASRQNLLNRLLPAGHETVLSEDKSGKRKAFSLDSKLPDTDRLHIVIDECSLTPSNKRRLIEAINLIRESGADCLSLLSNSEDEPTSLYPFSLSCNKCSFRPGALNAENLLPEHEESEIATWHSLVIAGVTIRELYRLNISALPELPWPAALSMQHATLLQAGLGHLRLSDKLRSLTAGEYFRLRLVLALGETAGRVLLALDEPSSVLGSAGAASLCALLRSRLGDTCSCLIADNDEDLRALADCEALLDEGRKTNTAIEFARPESSSSRRCPLPSSAGKNHATSGQSIKLAGLELELPASGLVSISDSSQGDPEIFFLKIQSMLRKNRGMDAHSSGLRLDNPGVNSSLATFLNLSDPIARLLAGLEASRIRGYKPAGFKKMLQGKGRPQEMEALRSLRLHDFSLSELLTLPLFDTRSAFSAIPACQTTLALLEKLNLLQLPLAGSLSKLSSGEISRLRMLPVLHSTLSDCSKGAPALLLLDRPAAFLDAAESANMARALKEITNNSICILALEQNVHFLNVVDYQAAL